MSQLAVGGEQFAVKEEKTEILPELNCQLPTANRQLSIHSLSLENFRNYASLRIETQGSSVILIGPNGAGKTNILEAISLLTPGRGFRRSKLLELDRHSSGRPWVVAAQVAGLQGEATLGTSRRQEEEMDRRLVRIGGREAKSQNELADHLAMLWLTPQMDQMWSEGDAAKRRFLDRLVYAFDSAHASRVGAYDYAMRERNRLLQDFRADPHWCDALEQKMAESATAITLARLQTVESLNHVMQSSPLSFPKAALSMQGFIEEQFQQGESALAAEKNYAAHLREERKNDALAGRTRTGAHKSILTIRYIKKNMDAEFCSTGEQKALLLSLVLAHARACAKWKAYAPVLLLDEVAAHLDAARRRELFQELRELGAQAWMTGTDTELFKDAGDDAQYYHVQQAELKRMGK